MIAYAALWIWLVLHVRRLREGGLLGSAVTALVFSTLIAAGLLLWNLRVTSHLSGAPFAMPLKTSGWPRGRPMWPIWVGRHFPL